MGIPSRVLLPRSGRPRVVIGASRAHHRLRHLTDLARGEEAAACRVQTTTNLKEGNTTMKKRLIVGLLAGGLMAAMLPGVVSADPGKPDFSAGVYADGEAWGTKATTSLPAPNGRNDQSFDKIFVFTNGADGQLPVGEAAPGNRDYNGGRWTVRLATWQDPPHPITVLTSYDEVMFHYNLGHLTITDAETYFQCPLLPVK